MNMRNRKNEVRIRVNSKLQHTLLLHYLYVYCGFVSWFGVISHYYWNFDKYLGYTYPGVVYVNFSEFKVCGGRSNFSECDYSYENFCLFDIGELVCVNNMGLF